jgi:enoyl-CoA hydratase/carnithine racemase
MKLLALNTSLELARTMNRKNPMVLRVTKKAINMNLDAGGFEEALNMEDRNQALLVARALLNKGEKTSRYF